MVSKRTLELLKQVDLNLDGIKLEEFINLDEDACVAAELTEENIVGPLISELSVIRLKLMTG